MISQNFLKSSQDGIQKKYDIRNISHGFDIIFLESKALPGRGEYGLRVKRENIFAFE